VSLDPSASAPLYQQVAADIRRKIACGETPVGARIQPHRHLATHYGVSIITINKALSGLVSEGLLYSHVGRGTFVKLRPASTSGANLPGTIGFVLHDLGSPFFTRIAHGAQQRADALGVGLVFASSSNRLDREEEQIRRLLALGVHGMLVVSMSRASQLSGPLQELHDSGFPYVMVSYAEGDDVSFVGGDLDTCGFVAGSHLVQCGRKRFGFLTDALGSARGAVCLRGYERAVRGAGLSVDPAAVFEAPADLSESAYDVGRRMAAMPVRPDAMFCTSDESALGLQDGLLDAGLTVPGDVAIVGIDDHEPFARARVPLTTLRQPVADIGARALDTLLQRVRGERPPARQLFAPELVVRASTRGI
jgi:LacI family transcriptional regulator